MLRNFSKHRVFHSLLRWNSGLAHQCSDMQQNQMKNLKDIQSISGIPNHILEQLYATLSSYGFQDTEIIQLVNSNTSLATRPSNTLINNIEFWRNYQFNNKLFKDLLIQHPELLNICNQEQMISKKIAILKEFVNTPKNIWWLLYNSPDILMKDTNEIKNYFCYLQKRMRLEISEIVKSKVFSTPLNMLKCRHVLLERLGIFEPAPLKRNPNEISKNPRLHRIIDTTDEEFCKKICGISITEFDAFKELFEKEIKYNETEADDSDED